MKFFLTGIETNNKGAELMLYAILQEIERRYPDSTVYIEENRVRQGLNYVKTTLDLRYNPKSYLVKIAEFCKINKILKRFCNKRILNLPFDIKFDYLIDGSGLVFSDQQKWLPEKNIYFSKILSCVKQHDTKVIFLPQAFGPIEKDYTQKAIKIIDKFADIVFARERVSYEYLKNSGLIDMNKVRISTDFTCLVEGVRPNRYAHLDGAVCIIPNFNMVYKGIVTAEEYKRFILLTVSLCRMEGKNVYLLNHEGRKDELISIEIQRSIGNIEVVSGLNAIETKGVISKAYLVITSRFHGLASSLNSCVPALSTSWNHKYKCLYEDYGIPDLVVDPKDLASYRTIVKEYLQVSKNDALRKKLTQSISSIEKQIDNMWRKIWTISLV